jgi:hypothetical protein
MAILLVLSGSTIKPGDLNAEADPRFLPHPFGMNARPGFGTISSAKPPRETQFGVRLAF